MLLPIYVMKKKANCRGQCCDVLILRKDVGLRRFFPRSLLDSLKVNRKLGIFNSFLLINCQLKELAVAEIYVRFLVLLSLSDELTAA